MITIQLRGGPLYQWDTDRQVEFRSLEDHVIDEVHFARMGEDCTITVLPYESGNKFVANIPNTLLTSMEKFTVYVVLHTENGEHTSTHRTFGVIPKPKPDDYVYTEEEQKTYDKLLELIESQQPNDIPAHLPNPNKLKLTGAVEAEYDGSSEVLVNIPKSAASWNDLTDKPFYAEMTTSKEDFYSGTILAAETKINKDYYEIGYPDEIVASVDDIDYILKYSFDDSRGAYMYTCQEDPLFYLRQMVVEDSLRLYVPDSMIGKTITLSMMSETEVVHQLDAKFIPDMPTDEHINELINTALGGIENGTY